MTRTAAEYNRQRTIEGEVTWDDWSFLVKYYQAGEGLVADGKFGPNTHGSMGGPANPAQPSLPLPNVLSTAERQAVVCPTAYRVVWPVARYRGRKWQVSSEHWLKNPSRAPGAYKKSNGSPYGGHQGIDIMLQRELDDTPKRELPADRYDGSWWAPPGTKVIAAADGVIVRLRKTSQEGVLAIRHADGYVTQYRHLVANSLVVRLGDTVACGSVIGEMGGGGTGLVHLHFELYAPQSFRSADDYDYAQSQSLWPTPWLGSVHV